MLAPVSTTSVPLPVGDLEIGGNRVGCREEEDQQMRERALV